MELRDVLRMLRKRWISIVAFTLAGVAVAALAGLFIKPVYTSSTTVVFSVQNKGPIDPGALVAASTYAEQQVATAASLTTSSAVLQPVIERLGLNTTTAALAPMVTTQVPSSTVMKVDVTSQDAQLSASLAREIGNEVITMQANRSAKDATGAQLVVAGIATPAAVAGEPSNVRPALNLLIGLLVGLALGIIQAAVRNALDVRVHGEREIALATAHQVSAKIPLDTALASGRFVLPDSNSEPAEAYRRLRASLQHAKIDDRTNAFVVTSSLAGEGKSVTAINVAASLAEAGDNVLLIDADLRSPAIARYLELEDGKGLSTVLTGRATLGSVVRSLGAGKPDVLTSGEVPNNPAELLGSEAMRKLLEQAGGKYDAVVLDTPPLLPVVDAASLSALCSGALVVVASDKVKVPELSDAVRELDRVGGAIVGVVLNNVPRRFRDSIVPPYRRAAAQPADVRPSIESVVPAESLSLPTSAVGAGVSRDR